MLLEMTWMPLEKAWRALTPESSAATSDMAWEFLVGCWSVCGSGRRQADAGDESGIVGLAADGDHRSFLVVSDLGDRAVHDPGVGGNGNVLAQVVLGIHRLGVRRERGEVLRERLHLLQRS